MLYALRASTMVLARRRVEGISETMVYTTGPTEKSATADRRSIMVPAVQDSASDGVDGTPIPPATLIVCVNWRLDERVDQDIHEQAEHHDHTTAHQLLPPNFVHDEPRAYRASSSYRSLSPRKIVCVSGTDASIRIEE